MPIASARTPPTHQIYPLPHQWKGESRTACGIFRNCLALGYLSRHSCCALRSGMMREKFEEWWASLPNRLPGGTLIRVWSERSGYTNQTFRFREIDREGAVVVDPPLRRVSKGDFAMVYRIWGDYCSGLIPRSKITENTVNSTYIISVLRWFDDHAND